MSILETEGKKNDSTIVYRDAIRENLLFLLNKRKNKKNLFRETRKFSRSIRIENSSHRQEIV